MMACAKLTLCLYGPFECHWSDGRIIALSGAKQRGLLAMLATAPNGLHSRQWIQEHLWGRSGVEHGRQSLRRSLSDLRKILDPHFDLIFETNNTDIRLRLENVELPRNRQDGIFFEGIDIPETKFIDWVQGKRVVRENWLGSSSVLAIAPSVAVLPFVAVSGSKDEVHFGDLIAMDIGRALSRSRLLEVISHLSSRQLGGRLLDMQDLRTLLNADYAISGNVRVTGNRFRLDVDFIQTNSGKILWTEPFHGDLSEILNGDSAPVAEIARQCGHQVLRASVEIAQSRPLPQVEAHALFMASISGMHQHQLSTFARSRDNLEELISRLPNHSKLHAWLAKWYLLSIAQGWSSDIAKDSKIAADSTARGLDIDPNCATALTIDGMVQGARAESLDIALARFELATLNDPNQGLAWLMYSRLNSFMNKGGLAVEQAAKARRLSPIDPHGYFYDVMEAMAHKVNGDYDKAIELARRSLKQNPRHISTYRLLTTALQLSGQDAEAKKTGKILQKLEPTLTIKSYLTGHPAGQMASGKIWAAALAEAGIPKT